MVEPLSTDDKIKHAELQLKQAELDLKKSELAERSRLTYTIMRNPIVIAAIITLLAAACTAIFGLVTSYVQAQEEHRKFQEQLNANIILSVLKETAINTPNSSGFSNNTNAELRMFLDAGLLTDDTGALRKMIEHQH